MTWPYEAILGVRRRPAIVSNAPPVYAVSRERRAKALTSPNEGSHGRTTRHRRTKGAETDTFGLQPTRHIPTLPLRAATPCRDRCTRPEKGPVVQILFLRP